MRPEISSGSNAPRATDAVAVVDNVRGQWRRLGIRALEELNRLSDRRVRRSDRDGRRLRDERRQAVRLRTEEVHLDALILRRVRTKVRAKTLAHFERNVLIRVRTHRHFQYIMAPGTPFVEPELRQRAGPFDPIFREQLEDVVANEHAALEAFHADLAVDVFRHVRDDALLALAELGDGRLRALLASLAAWFFEAETHASCLSERAIGA